jgi:hypothetical protein
MFTEKAKDHATPFYKTSYLRINPFNSEGISYMTYTFFVHTKVSVKEVDHMNRSNKPNRLKSPCLLQHARTQLIGILKCEAVFEKATTEDKPIFLSIGIVHAIGAM